MEFEHKIGARFWIVKQPFMTRERKKEIKFYETLFFLSFYFHIFR